MPNKILGSDFMVLQRQGVFVPDKDYDDPKFPENEIRTDTDIYHFTGEDLFFTVEQEMNGTFVRTDGDTMTGDLVMKANIDVDYSKGAVVNFIGKAGSTTLSKINVTDGTFEGSITFQHDPTDDTLKVTGGSHTNKFRNWKGSGMKFIDETEFWKPLQLNGTKASEQAIDVKNTSFGARLTFGGDDRFFWGNTHLTMFKELRMGHNKINELFGGDNWHGTFKFKTETKSQDQITKFELTRHPDAATNAAFGLDIQLTYDSAYGKIRFLDKKETVMQITGGTKGRMEVFRNTHYLLDEGGNTPALVFGKDHTKASYLKVLNKAMLGIYGYSTNDSSSSYTTNIRVKHNETQVKYLPDPTEDGDAVNYATLKRKLEDLADTIKGIADASAPVGSIMAMERRLYGRDPHPEKPVGWLLCDGTHFDPAQYPELYKFLGNTDHTPDLRGYFLAGVGQNARWPETANIDNRIGMHRRYSTGVPYVDRNVSSPGTGQAGGHRHNFSIDKHNGFGGGSKNALQTDPHTSITFSTEYEGNHSHSINWDPTDTKPNTYPIEWWIRADYPDAFFSV